GDAVEAELPVRDLPPGLCRFLAWLLLGGLRRFLRGLRRVAAAGGGELAAGGAAGRGVRVRARLVRRLDPLLLVVLRLGFVVLGFRFLEVLVVAGFGVLLVVEFF